MAVLLTTGIDLGAAGFALNFALENLGSDPGSPRASRMWWLTGTGIRVYDGTTKHTVAYLDTSLSAFGTPTADIGWGTYKITGLADPVNAQDAATKAFVLGVVQNETWKDACDAATTGPITLAGAQTVDGVPLTAGMRCFVKNQASSQADGIYVVADPGAWSYATDWATANVIDGCVIPISTGGTANGSTLWKLITANPITVGTTPLSFVQIPTGGSYTAANIGAGTGVFSGMSGNQFQFYSLGSADTSISLGVVTNVITFTFNPANVNINNFGGAPLTVSMGGTGVQTLSPKFVTCNGTAAFGSVATINLGTNSGTDISGWLTPSYGGTVLHLPANACSTTNITIASPGASIDGVSLSSGQRVLLVGQLTGSQNGPWIWNGAAVPMARPTDYAAGSTIQAVYGIQATVLGGTANGGTSYYLATTGAITIDTTATTWTALPFNLTNATFTGTLGVSNGGTGGSTAAAAKTNLGFMTRFAQTFGDNVTTSFVIAHGMGTADIIPRLYRLSDGFMSIECDIYVDATNITLNFPASVPPTTNQYRVVVEG